MQRSTRARTRARPRPSVQQVSLAPARLFAPVSHRFGGLLTVVLMAKALQIFGVGEPRPVSLVVDDVVDVCRLGADPHPGTLAAPWLLGQLHIPQHAPGLGLVQPMPGCRRATPLIHCPSWAVGIAIPIRHQLGAARVAAWPERFLAHGLSPPGKQKEPGQSKSATRLPRWDQVALAHWHWLSGSIFTMVSCLHRLQ